MTGRGSTDGLAPTEQLLVRVLTTAIVREIRIAELAPGSTSGWSEKRDERA